MRSIFLKIFLSFWLAENLSIFATAFLLRHHFDGPEIQHRSLFQTMMLSGNEAAYAYSTGGCEALGRFVALTPEPSYLIDQYDQVVCNQRVVPGLEQVVRGVHARSRPVVGVQVGNRYLWGVNVRTPSGEPAIFVITGPYTESGGMPIRDILPRLMISVAISGMVILVLAFLLTRPIQRLREAARRMARGELSARASKHKGKPASSGTDEIGALVADFDHMAERLESQVAAQRLLLRDVSHELRSPLARLSVALELARDEAAAEMTPHLDRIERETNNLNQLIGQLLSLSQMESAQRIADVKPVALRPILERLVADAGYEAQTSHCTVVLNRAADCTISGNAELLHRALENIVRNAIHYTAEGTQVEISLDCEPVGQGREAVVQVMDRGSGVPEEQLQAIFKPFYRLDYARERSTGGSGVGLAIAERAIRLHSGRLSAANRPGGGLTVEVRIPCL